MSDKAKEPAKEPAPAPAQKVDEFRRAAALAVLSAYVTRHGGFAELEMDVLMRQVWRYADVFVSLEHAAPLPPPAPEVEHPGKPPGPGRNRPAHPTDEWAVVDNGKRKRGFITHEEAEWYAAERPGATIVQVAGPEIDARVMATE